jgi:hypothetical protein
LSVLFSDTVGDLVSIVLWYCCLLRILTNNQQY